MENETKGEGKIGKRGLGFVSHVYRYAAALPILGCVRLETHQQMGKLLNYVTLFNTNCSISKSENSGIFLQFQKHFFGNEYLLLILTLIRCFPSAKCKR